MRDMVDAYNARDVDRMLSYFADDAVILSADGTIVDAGKRALRDTFAPIFARNPELHADVPTWIEVGDWVCIHSIVEDWIHTDGTHARVEWVELYQVINGEITRLQLFSYLEPDVAGVGVKPRAAQHLGLDRGEELLGLDEGGKRVRRRAHLPSRRL